MLLCTSVPVCLYLCSSRSRDDSSSSQSYSSRTDTNVSFSVKPSLNRPVRTNGFLLCSSKTFILVWHSLPRVTCVICCVHGLLRDRGPVLITFVPVPSPGQRPSTSPRCVRNLTRETDSTRATELNSLI